MPLFEVAILEEPTKKQRDDEGALERLVYGPVCVIAKDEASAPTVAVMGQDIKIEGSRIKVLVRPFV